MAAILIIYPALELSYADEKKVVEIDNTKILNWCNDKWQDSNLECKVITKVKSKKDKKISKREIINYIKTKNWDSRIALAIMKGEGGWNTHAFNRNKNGSTDKGLFQINSVHNKKNLYNWKTNIDAAYYVYTISKPMHNGNGWMAWVAYKNGSYKRHL